MLNERDKQFFNPLWRRVAITVFCAGWSIWEWTRQESFWGMMTAAIAAYCVWVFFVKFEQTDPKIQTDGKSESQSEAPAPSSSDSNNED